MTGERAKPVQMEHVSISLFASAPFIRISLLSGSYLMDELSRDSVNPSKYSSFSGNETSTVNIFRISSGRIGTVSTAGGTAAVVDAFSDTALGFVFRNLSRATRSSSHSL